jgi:hypothetical protein
MLPSCSRSRWISTTVVRRDMFVGREWTGIPRPCKPASRASPGSNRSAKCSHLSHIRVSNHVYTNSGERLKLTCAACTEDSFVPVVRIPSSTSTSPRRGKHLTFVLLTIHRAHHRPRPGLAALDLPQISTFLQPEMISMRGGI